MNLLIMTVVAVMVGLTTMGAMTWAYVAEDRAFRPTEPERATDQPEREQVSA